MSTTNGQSSCSSTCIQNTSNSSLNLCISKQNNGKKRGAMDEDSNGDSSSSNKKQRKTDLDHFSEYVPKISVEQIESPPGFTHHIAYPNITGYKPVPLQPIKDPAQKYSFQLDPFQERAITCVDNCQSVLISAHTSAGKTAIAEYAIAKALKNNQRVIYTTPIKALSNQKYREFYETFQDVGLITGDVTINPSAGCLIMTTEILRNMLYRGSKVLQDVYWVIFDEIHYMVEKERGVIWEETLILLPSKIHCIFLSATVPNSLEFAQWISYIHLESCHVIHTSFRPVPLHHYVCPVGGEGLHLVMDDKGNFSTENFTKAIQSVNRTISGRIDEQDIENPQSSPFFQAIQSIIQNGFGPIIAFTFSKNNCERLAALTALMDFTNNDEKELIEEVFTNAMEVLRKEDQQLPLVLTLLPMLKNGIGIHHGGLLPVLKEIIEILFAEGLIKVLFATETFAMGLNMPARTVLFTEVKKFDGRSHRWLNSREYIQMSGRAGRRGIDETGSSIVIIDDKINLGIARALMTREAGSINSAFYLKYNMILNLIRVDGINPEFMMERSFYQFQKYMQIPTCISELKKAEAAYEQIHVPNEEVVENVYQNLLNSVTGSRTTEKEFIDLLKNKRNIIQQQLMVENPLPNETDKQNLYRSYEKKLKLKRTIEARKLDLEDCENLVQMPELKCRMKVLRKLGFIATTTDDDALELKGRVACELTNGDELVLTELIFSGIFLQLDTPCTVSLLSCIVCDERTSEKQTLTDDLASALSALKDIARNIAKVSTECGLMINEEVYVNQFKPFLMGVVYQWCKGTSFDEICEMQEDIYEGGIIRCMKRLEELLKQMSLAAKVIGNKELENKFNDGLKLLCRGIVCASSLYL